MVNYIKSYNKTKFTIVYSIHFIICALLVFGWTFRNKLWLEFLILTSIYIQSMYGLFNGCICTRIERKYNKWRKENKSSIIDPIINIFSINKTRNNIDFMTGLFVNMGLICTFTMRYIYL